MNAPWTLRWALAWAALRGGFLGASVVADHRGIRYTFEVEPRSVQRWLDRRDREREKRRIEKEQGS